MKKNNFYILLFFVFLFAAFTANAGSDKKKDKSKNNCYTCHKQDENLPDNFSTEDVHFKLGITCADCHGGDITSTDEDVAMDENNGFVGAPSKKETPAFCGKCHSNIEYMKQYNPSIETDQVKEYYTSVHGHQLKKGNEDVATCTDCHTAHSIFKPNDPRSTVYALNVPTTCDNCHGNKNLMAKYKLPSNPYHDYSNGVHGIALLKNHDIGAPACNDCHGNHGATPPGASSITQICGQCHVNNMNYFKASKMGQNFEDYHGCVECHSNHLINPPTDDFVGVGNKAICIDCHDKGDKGYEEANLIHSQISTLDSILTFAKEKIKVVKEKNMDDVEINFLLKDAHQSLIKSRTLVHTFSSDKVGKETNKGIKITKKAIILEEEAIHASFVRRNGFLIAILFITIIIIALYLRIREMDKNKKEQHTT